MSVLINELRAIEFDATATRLLADIYSASCSVVCKWYFLIRSMTVSRDSGFRLDGVIIHRINYETSYLFINIHETRIFLRFSYQSSGAKRELKSILYFTYYCQFRDVKK